MSSPRKAPPAHVAQPRRPAAKRELFQRFDRTELLVALGIFVVALGVRLIYLYESSDSPTFHTPIVDARNYDDLARELAPHVFAAGAADEKLTVPSRLNLFWQPFLYPYALASLYRIAQICGADRLILAKVAQLVVGALTCLLVYALGRKLFDRPTAIIAALLTAFYGPLIYYEADLVAAGWAACGSVALVLLAIKAERDRSLLAWLGLGLLGGLAVLMRPTFFPFLLALLAYLVVQHIRHRRDAIELGVRVVPALVLFVLAVYPVAHKARNFDLVHNWTFLPISGGINFYIGNNPDLCDTLNTRPGMTKWSLLAEPSGQPGDTNTLERSQLLGRQARQFVFSHPLQFVGGLIAKGFRFLSGREMPRNEDVYVFRQWSGILSVLLWKAGPFGFPWGVLFPLAVVGVVWRWREMSTTLLLYLALYPLSIILIFVAARYRVETVPVFAIPAAACITRIIQAARARQWLTTAVPLGVAALLALLTSLPGPFCEEQVNYEAEMYVWLGDDKRLAAEPLLRPATATQEIPAAQAAEAQRLTVDARALYEKAVTLAPDSVVAHVHLGYLLKSLRLYQEAIAQFDAALAQEPDFIALYYRGDAYSGLRNNEAALRDFTASLAAEPRYKPALLARAALYQRLGRVEEAKADCRGVLNLTPQAAEYLDAQSQLREKTARLQTQARQQNRELTPAEREQLVKCETMTAILSQKLDSHPDGEAARQARRRLSELEKP